MKKPQVDFLFCLIQKFKGHFMKTLQSPFSKFNFLSHANLTWICHRKFHFNESSFFYYCVFSMPWPNTKILKYSEHWTLNHTQTHTYTWLEKCLRLHWMQFFVLILLEFHIQKLCSNTKRADQMVYIITIPKTYQIAVEAWAVHRIRLILVRFDSTPAFYII